MEEDNESDSRQHEVAPPDKFGLNVVGSGNSGAVAQTPQESLEYEQYAQQGAYGHLGSLSLAQHCRALHPYDTHCSRMTRTDGPLGRPECRAVQAVRARAKSKPQVRAVGGIGAK
eukprot:gene25605-11257_t